MHFFRRHFNLAAVAAKFYSQFMGSCSTFSFYNSAFYTADLDKGAFVTYRFGNSCIINAERIGES